MHVELLGLPGSGKTTFYQEIIKQARLSNKKIMSTKEAIYIGLKNKKKRETVYNKLSLLKYLRFLLWGHEHIKSSPYYKNYYNDCLISFIADNTDLVELIFKYINNDFFRIHEKKLVCKWFFNLFTDYEIISNNISIKEIFVIDEGFTQRVITLFGYGEKIKEKDVKYYLNLIPVPDLIFLINSDPVQCYERMLRRGFPQRLQGKEKDQIIYFLKLCSGLINKTTAILQKKGIPIVQVNNIGSLNGLRDFAMNTVYEILDK